MDYQQILELVKEVSKAGLTNFEYTEGNIRIAMSCPQPEEKLLCRHQILFCRKQPEQGLIQ